MGAERHIGRRYRIATGARVLLAGFGGYALAAASTALLSLILPLDQAEAVVAATLLSFAVMAGAILFVFAARSLQAAAIGLGLPLAAIGAGLWLAMSSAGSPA